MGEKIGTLWVRPRQRKFKANQQHVFSVVSHFFCCWELIPNHPLKQWFLGTAPDGLLEHRHLPTMSWAFGFTLSQKDSPSYLAQCTSSFDHSSQPLSIYHIPNPFHQPWYLLSFHLRATFVLSWKWLAIEKYPTTLPKYLPASFLMDNRDSWELSSNPQISPLWAQPI